MVQIICTKVRDGAKRIVRLKEGEPEGRHVVIVDDLVQSGSTLIECQVRSEAPHCSLLIKACRSGLVM
jgi:hypoxanthine-guanine phosphoribosyltransferase